MLAKLKDLLARSGPGGAPGSATGGEASGTLDPLMLAAAVLMLEAASMDNHIDEDERAKIAELLTRRFQLSPQAVGALMREAEERVLHSVDIYGFTRDLKDRFSAEERIELMEMLWEIAYVDGELHDLEATLMRRLAGLLYVSDRASGEARKRAIRRLGQEGLD
jgi:uncharacterized tellurite resistance protein B-like protein